MECTVTHWTNEGCFLRRWYRFHRRREIGWVSSLFPFFALFVASLSVPSLSFFLSLFRSSCLSTLEAQLARNSWLKHFQKVSAAEKFVRIGIVTRNRASCYLQWTGVSGTDIRSRRCPVVFPSAYESNKSMNRNRVLRTLECFSCTNASRLSRIRSFRSLDSSSIEDRKRSEKRKGQRLGRVTNLRAVSASMRLHLTAD